MDVRSFLEDRSARWLELERLLERVEGAGLAGLPIDEARRFVALYRSASGDLMMARSRSASADVVDYLNDLVARAYVHVYRGPPLRLGAVARFYSHGFPRKLRRHAGAALLSAACLLGGAAFGAAGVAVDPVAAPYLVPEQHRDVDPAARVAREEGREVAPAGSQATFASFLFTHNARVSFLVFVLGFSFGIGTIVVLFVNGVMLGSLAAAYHAAGEGLFFWAWILPHGIPELTEVVIAGAAGLVLARGLVIPGPAGRRAALRATGRDAVHLVLGGLPILLVAGLIEGTISQIHEPTLPYPLKLAFAAAVGVLLYLWLLAGGRIRGSTASRSA